ncbi:MAG: putative transposase [Dokdonia sp.]|jgi:putative transposase
MTKMQPKPSFGVTQFLLYVLTLHPEVRRFLWEGKFWTSGYYMNILSQYANGEVVKKYVQGQGSNQKYQEIHKSQLKLF